MGRQPDIRFIPEDAEIIRHKIRKLIGQYGFTVSDEPDLQQELAMHVSIRMAQHDPSRAARSTFVDRIVRNKIVNILEHRMAKKRGGRTGLPVISAIKRSAEFPCPAGTHKVFASVTFQYVQTPQPPLSGSRCG